MTLATWQGFCFALLCILKRFIDELFCHREIPLLRHSLDGVWMPQQASEICSEHIIAFVHEIIS